jgi:conjugal transfer/entry exclusion protein
MQSANELVRSTDTLVKATEFNAKLIEQGISNSMGAKNTLQALQGNAQILTALGNEMQAVSGLLYSEQRFIQTLIDNNGDATVLKEEIAKRLIAAPDPYDPDNPLRDTAASAWIKESLTGTFLEGSERIR